MVYFNSVLVAALLALSPAPLAAELRPHFTGEGLLKECTVKEQELNGANLSLEQMYDSASCITYIAAIRETIDLYSPMLAKAKQLICIPKDVRAGQLVRVVLKWLRDHPERLNSPRFNEVMLAFQNAWPCVK